MTQRPLLFGICGAPSTGKTTLARMASKRLVAAGYQCEVLPELARILAARGVKIDTEMGPRDYDAFLAAYDARDTETGSQILLADRTPIDHYSYLAANENATPELLERHRRHVLESVKRYNLFFYLPIQFPMKADGFRTTDTHYQARLDAEICALLDVAGVHVITLREDKRRRARKAVEVIEQQVADTPAATSEAF